MKTIKHSFTRDGKTETTFIDRKDILSFLEYYKDFYSDFEDANFETDKEIELAIMARLECETYPEFCGDSFDREIVRDLILDNKNYKSLGLDIEENDGLVHPKARQSLKDLKDKLNQAKQVLNEKSVSTSPKQKI